MSEGGRVSDGVPETPREPLSDAVPDAPARAVEDASVTDRMADYLDDAADRLLTDDALRDEDVAGLGSDAVTFEAPQRDATTKRSGKAVKASPLLSMPRARRPKAVALFIHGGDVTGYLAMRRGDPAYLRMIPFARDVERRSRGRVGAAVLRLAVRGWNDPDKPAVEDARWALRELRRRYPNLPIAVVGHSMGGRVVLELAATEELAAIVALAPWAADEYPAHLFVGTPLLGIHGRQDTVTDPDATRDLVERVVAAGGDARFVSMPGWHAMLWHPMRWHKASSAFLIDHLTDRPGRRPSGTSDGEGAAAGPGSGAGFGSTVARSKP